MELYFGIDWSEHKHDVCVLNAAGAVLAQLTIPHRPAPFAALETLRRKLGVAPAACLISLETAHNLLIDLYLGTGLHSRLRHCAQRD